MQSINFIRVANENIQAVATGDEVFDITRYSQAFEFQKNTFGINILIRSAFQSSILLESVPTGNISFEGVPASDYSDLESLINDTFFSHVI